MTLLSIAQTVANRLQLPSPATVISNTDNNVILIRSMLEKALLDLKDIFPWPKLQREHTFTLATSTASYALPLDFDRFLNETMWNRDQNWPLIGPINAQEWQNWKSGIVTTLPRQRFRVKGWTDNQMFIDPTPSSDENGQTCVFEYISSTIVKPKVWVASTVWTGIQYCSYNGNIYTRGSTGVATTGTTAPTHSTGAVTDGLITWTFTNAIFQSFVHDTDDVILDETMVIDGTVWRFKEERGLDFEDLRQQAENKIDTMKTKLSGSGVVTINSGSVQTPMIGTWSYPEGSY